MMCRRLRAAGQCMTVTTVPHSRSVPGAPAAEAGEALPQKIVGVVRTRDDLVLPQDRAGSLAQGARLDYVVRDRPGEAEPYDGGITRRGTASSGTARAGRTAPAHLMGSTITSHERRALGVDSGTPLLASMWNSATAPTHRAPAADEPTVSPPAGRTKHPAQPFRRDRPSRLRPARGMAVQRPAVQR